MRKIIFISGVVIATLSMAVWAKDAPSQAAAQSTIETSIQWTALGIPHIQAGDEKSLGYGIGYAYALDNICLLADEVLTVRGERAQRLGAAGRSSAQINNVDSDFFFRWLNSDAAVAEFLQTQPTPIRLLLAGYAAGVNRYLRDVAPESLPKDCRIAGLQPVVEEDVARLIRRLLVEGGIGRFAEALVGAKPPGSGSSSAAANASISLNSLSDFAQSHGSNAIAVGGRRTENGKGRLLANPHFPWSGGLRFYAMHLTIPGRLDVMGAALPGFPMINIGFNRNLAWTHTVDTSSHFTLHRLQLDPKDPMRYVVDGQSDLLKKHTLTIQVLEPDGQLKTQTRDIYESRFGPVIAAAGGLEWTADQAYALQDVNLANARAPAQWYALNQAYSLAGFRKALLDIQGVPWVNTLAVDDRGQALYANISVVPNIPSERLAACVDSTSQTLGLPGFDGSRAFCDWQPDSPVQVGSVAGSRMPILQRDDYVQNSNDSAWLSNPAAPLTGFSPLIAAQNKPLRLRTRYALTRLGAQTDKPYSEEFLKHLLSDNQVYAADLVLDDLLNLCKSLRSDRTVKHACAAMAAWDRTANRTSGVGFLYFRAFMAVFEQIEGGWRQPFDPNDPLHTPRGLALNEPAIAEKLKQALRETARRVDALDIPTTATWGEIQVARRGDKSIPIPGGDGSLGVYNAIESRAMSGRREVISGSSYIQLVSFDEQGPVAHGLLAFSQSTNPASPHFSDQTELFSRQEWPLLPFTAEQIQANPPVKRLQLRE